MHFDDQAPFHDSLSLSHSALNQAQLQNSRIPSSDDPDLIWDLACLEIDLALVRSARQRLESVSTSRARSELTRLRQLCGIGRTQPVSRVIVEVPEAVELACRNVRMTSDPEDPPDPEMRSLLASSPAAVLTALYPVFFEWAADYAQRAAAPAIACGDFELAIACERYLRAVSAEPDEAFLLVPQCRYHTAWQLRWIEPALSQEVIASGLSDPATRTFAVEALAWASSPEAVVQILRAPACGLPLLSLDAEPSGWRASLALVAREFPLDRSRLESELQSLLLSDTLDPNQTCTALALLNDLFPPVPARTDRLCFDIDEAGTVIIRINDRPLLQWFSPGDRDYEELPPCFLSHSLSRQASDEYGFGRVRLMDHQGCEAPGCWPVVVRVAGSERGICWSNFANPHCQGPYKFTDYSQIGPFCFAPQQYADELEKLAKFQQ